MKVFAISDALCVLIAARQPVFIWADLDIGKSAVVRQLAETSKVPPRDVRALLATAGRCLIDVSLNRSFRFF